MDQFWDRDDADVTASVQECMRRGLRDFEIVGTLHSPIIRATATDPVSEQEITLMILGLSGPFDERFTFQELPAGRYLETSGWLTVVPGTSFADLLKSVADGDPDFWRTALRALLRYYDNVARTIRGTLEATAEELGRTMEESCNEVEPASRTFVPEVDQEFKALTEACKGRADWADWISIDANYDGSVNVSFGLRPGNHEQVLFKVTAMGDYGSFMDLNGLETHMFAFEEQLPVHFSDPAELATARAAANDLISIQSAAERLISAQREKTLASLKDERSGLLLDAFLDAPGGAEKLVDFDATSSTKLDEALDDLFARVDRFLSGVYRRKEAGRT